jgi:hypothetical protein
MQKPATFRIDRGHREFEKVFLLLFAGRNSSQNVFYYRVMQKPATFRIDREHREFEKVFYY